MALSQSSKILVSDINTALSGKQDILGFVPVQQGGGTGQGVNKVYIGWSGTGLKYQVDTTDMGYFVKSVNGAIANSNGNVSISATASSLYALCGTLVNSRNHIF